MYSTRYMEVTTRKIDTNHRFCMIQARIKKTHRYSCAKILIPGIRTIVLRDDYDLKLENNMCFDDIFRYQPTI